MEFQFECPSCKKSISSTFDKIGHLVSCSICNSETTVPNPFVTKVSSQSTQHLQPELPSSIVASKSIKPNKYKAFFRFVAIGCGSLIVGFIGLIILLVAISPHSSSPPSSEASSSPEPRIEDVLLSNLQPTLETNKQKIFDAIHPLGTAKSLKVHRVTIDSWKNGIATNRAEDIFQFTIIYTLYWEGGTTSDGFTKISSTYDTESSRIIKEEIVATNGLTNQGIQNGTYDAATKVFGEILKGSL
jgi:hypothetical protein